MAQQLTRTLSQIRTRVRRYIKQPDPDKSYWDNNFLDQVFNSHYRLRATELHLATEGHFREVYFRDLEADKARYEWPPGFTRLLKLELVKTDGRTVPLKRYERNYEPLDTAGSSGDGYMPTFRPLSGGFVLEPQPTSTVSNGLRMEINCIPSELTADNDCLHNDFPEMFDELLVLDTVVGLLHAEEVQEVGLQRTFMTFHKEWQAKWERYINNRINSQQRIVPFITHYESA